MLKQQNTIMLNLSEEDSEDSDGIWQQVPETKRLTISTNMHQHKKFNASEEPSTSRENQFQILDKDVDVDQSQDQAEPAEEQNNSTPKPPPIYIPNVLDISIMIKNISKQIPSTDFSYKSMRDNQIRLMVKEVESFRKIVTYFESKSISYHTYQLKQERAYRVVIKGLHPSTLTTDIISELSSLGHQVRDVINVKSRVTKLPLSMFFVDLDPNSNKEIFNIRHITNRSS